MDLSDVKTYKTKAVLVREMTGNQFLTALIAGDFYERVVEWEQDRKMPQLILVRNDGEIDPVKLDRAAITINMVTPVVVSTSENIDLVLDKIAEDARTGRHLDWMPRRGKLEKETRLHWHYRTLPGVSDITATRLEETYHSPRKLYQLVCDTKKGGTTGLPKHTIAKIRQFLSHGTEAKKE